MIKKLQIQNFKCFQQESSFEFSKLNLLTGINGRGKSSLLQTLLVLSQSANRNNPLKKLILNGELVELGNYDDIKNSETPRGESIKLQLTFDSPILEQVNFQFGEDADHPLYASCEKIELRANRYQELLELSEENQHFNQTWIAISGLIKKLHFVSANRLGPVKYVEKTNLPEFVNVGPRGEHTVNILANSLNLPNVNELLYLGRDSRSVMQQTVEWLSYILEGARIEIKGRERESSVLHMLLNNRNNSYGYKPANVGFGYSYILPLIVTGLIAQAGEMIVIENPEAHLHPRAQARIAEFFVKVAACGVQVFIESHSEHILNGLRINTLKTPEMVNFDELIIHYFNETFDSEKLQMEKSGKILKWPTGFFDQQEIDLSDIFKLNMLR
jgi:predicted ATPase